MTTEQLKDKCRGSLVGGAAGDALGYAVEFDSLADITRRYGNPGITDYVTDAQGTALFSDDTQMTLFTAEGLLRGVAAGKSTPDSILPYITAAYLDWYRTQTRRPGDADGSARGLLAEERLWARRAPGITCLSAMKDVEAGYPVINDSKGCGGVMRVAPAGIYAAAHPETFTIAQAEALAGMAAEITHRHELSTLASMALSGIVARCIGCERPDRDAFRDIVLGSVTGPLTAIIRKALTLAVSELPDTDAIRTLGEGWVAEETLAIAVFSVMRHIDSFERCLVCAVNHDGDSDSTGAVAGNIIGALLGYDAIPARFTAPLELHGLLVDMAEGLAAR